MNLPRGLVCGRTGSMMQASWRTGVRVGSSELEQDETEVRIGTSTLGNIADLVKCPMLGAGYEGGYNEGMIGKDTR
jgi:hypothetical protein